MKGPRAALISSVLLAACIMATGVASSQTRSKALFTNDEPFLCVGGGFVAMAGTTDGAPLIVITIDAYGIGAPKTFPTGAEDVIGMLCSEHQIELLVVDGETHWQIVALYTVQQHVVGPTTIQIEQPEELNLPKSGPIRPALQFKEESLKYQRYAWTGRRGDWYVGVGDVDVPDKDYELHFVSNHTA